MKTAILSTLFFGSICCCDDAHKEQFQPTKAYQFHHTQAHTAIVNWNPHDFKFEEGNRFYMNYYTHRAPEPSESMGCSSWRNGGFHGRNLDWYQANYGCLVIRMPKGGYVKHASVALLNGNKTVTREFIRNGVLTEEQKKFLPCLVVDGINDAGVAVNINIVPHDPARQNADNDNSDLSSQCVVRYILDNADNVNHAVELLAGRVVQQSIVNLADDETHYMISDPSKTAVVEFIDKQMKVIYYTKQQGGFFSSKGNPAIMVNLYNFAVEKYGCGNMAMFEEFHYGLGVERLNTIKEQYESAKLSVKDNFKIAKSVWFFDNFITKRTPWYSENGQSDACGKDDYGWWYKPNEKNGETKRAASYEECMKKLYDDFMPSYWADYYATYGEKADPHVEGNDFWETSHSVIYDLNNKIGYLYPFENRYQTAKYPYIELRIP